jgi:hypothetical protein
MTTTDLTRSNGAAPAVPDLPSYEVMEKVLGTGDIASLTAKQRVEYYTNLCRSVGLNPMSRPFEFISFQGKTVPYAKKDCTDQLRMIHSVSLRITERDLSDGMYTVTAHALMPNGRTDESTGVVSIGNLQGEARANAYMKAETKAKRRVTLSICGLGFLDESEVDSVPGAQRVRFDPQSGDMELPKAQPVASPAPQPSPEEQSERTRLSAYIKTLPSADQKAVLSWMKSAFNGRVLKDLNMDEMKRLDKELHREDVSAVPPVTSDNEFHNVVTAKAGIPSDRAEGEGYVSESASPNDDPFDD